MISAMTSSIFLLVCHISSSRPLNVIYLYGFGSVARLSFIKPPLLNSALPAGTELYLPKVVAVHAAPIARRAKSMPAEGVPIILKTRQSVIPSMK